MSALSLFRPESESPSISVPDVVIARIAYLAERVSRGHITPRNLENHKFYLGRFARALPLPVARCSQKDFENWIFDNPRWKSGHTKKTAMGIVVECFTWAADSEQGDLIDRNPFKRIKAVGAIPYQPRRAASADEYLALIRHGNLPMKQGLFFVYRTGCRPCEMRELIWPWVQDSATSPHAKLERHKTFKKTGKAKLIGLDEVTVRFLRCLRRRRTWHDTRACNCSLHTEHGFEHKVGDHVFLNSEGNAWKGTGSFAQSIRRAAERAGLDHQVIVKKVSTGCMRTTYACDLIEMGFSNRKVADALGHESTWMVDHVYGAATRQRAEHLEDIVNQAAKGRGKKPGKTR